MKKSNKSTKCFTNRAAVLILAASLVIMGLFTACPNTAGGGGTSSGGNTGGGTTLTKVVYLAGSITTGGNPKPHYWKNGTKYELSMDKGYANSLTLKDGKAYSAGAQKNSG